MTAADRAIELVRHARAALLIGIILACRFYLSEAKALGSVACAELELALRFHVATLPSSCSAQPIARRKDQGQ